MKNTLLKTMQLLLIAGQGICAYAQTEYGDGTQRQTGAYQEFYNSGSAKFEASDSWQYTYNAQGKETRMVSLGYSTVSKLWNPWFVGLSEYDGNGNKTVEVDSHLNPGQFGYRVRKEFKYNGNNQEIEQILYSWNTTTSKWEKSYRYTSHYNGTGDMDTMVTEKYDNGTSQFVKYKKEWRVYDAGHQPLEEWFQVYSTADSKWINEEKVFRTYTGSGKVATYQNMKINFITKDWQNDSRVEYDYNSEGKYLSVKAYKWNNTNKVWDYSSRENYVYSTNSYYSVSEIYDNTGKVWIGSWKTMAVLLPQGWPAETTTQQWDVNTNAWVNKYKRSWDYNSHGYGVYTLGSIWDAAGNKWKFSGRAWHYYENWSGILEHAAMEMQVYPNPVQDRLSIRTGIDFPAMATIQILDLTGKELASENCELNNGTGTMELANKNLTSGLYLCRLNVAGRSITKQIIIK